MDGHTPYLPGMVDWLHHLIPEYSPRFESLSRSLLMICSMV
jgi:hypothetical protein